MNKWIKNIFTQDALCNYLNSDPKIVFVSTIIINRKTRAEVNTPQKKYVKIIQHFHIH